jgi:putative spermidine/putrescine transport system permease protein
VASLVAPIGTEEVSGVAEEMPAATQKKHRRPRFFRGFVLLVAAVYFLLPLFAGLKYTFEDAYGNFSLSTVKSISSQPYLGSAVWLTVRLAVLAMVVTMALMIPTTVYVHLKLPKMRPVMDLVTLLPIVFPPIVLVLGVLKTYPLALRNSPYMLSLLYVILAMPFVYRSLDAGLGAIDLKTLVEASKSLGGRWISTLFRVILPNLTTALISAVVLTIALVFAEFTLAYLTQWQTISVWIVQFNGTDGHITVAVSMLLLLGTWILLSAIVVVDLIRSRQKLKRRATAS